MHCKLVAAFILASLAGFVAASPVPVPNADALSHDRFPIAREPTPEVEVDARSPEAELDDRGCRWGCY
ncbi:hypothetical protein Moror_5319 [Moniliophthora roreri MCA 2997]|uniref:Uncharacterized protein n=2 Tax=Moniliophthora roreri TaxID=221103 RepID=V2X8G8_MONRO|nr:hypothetical protein Moror_5319 [Moniliophthora roreri MCA 2997]KAI3595103.1 hypothetical protein WG66_001133 [Moniliophthora roreri]